MDPERLVPRDDHVAGGVAPGGRLLEVGTERRRVARVARDRVGGGAQVPLGQQVGVDVVVRDRAVLVRAGDAVDPEPALRVVVAERTPEPRRLDEQLEADLALERLVAGRALVPDHGVGDRAREVERRGAGRPVARAFLAPDRPPRKNGAGEPELGGALAGEVERRVPPAQRVAGRLRRGVGQHRQDEALGVPERVPVIARTGQALGGDRAPLRASAPAWSVWKSAKRTACCSSVSPSSSTSARSQNSSR